MAAPTAACGDNVTDIGGTIWRDYNANGTQESGELGFGTDGMLVTAYDTANSVAMTATVQTDGSYVFPTLANGNPYRLEVSGLPGYLEFSAAGGNSGTGTLFVDDATCAADVAVQNPGDYCEDNPLIATACYLNGDPLGGGSAGTGEWLVAFRYDNSGQKTDGGYIPPELMVNGTMVGATWGSAWHRNTEHILASAVMKRHSGFGQGGTGAIYQVTTAGVATELLDLNDYPGVSTGSDTRDGTTNNSLPADHTVANRDLDAFTAVGKVGIGDIDLSDDGTVLYAVNLNDRSLHEIVVGDSLTAPATIVTHDLAAALDGLYPSGDGAACPDSADYRPWAVDYHDGLVYVGAVCSAETSQTESALRAYIIRFDPANPGAGFSKVVDTPLAGTREAAFEDDNADERNELDGDWQPWATSWSAVQVNGWLGTAHPSPILSDIEFDTDGSIIIGLIDRFGMQSGLDQYRATSSGTTLYEGIAAGDTLRFCNVNGTLVFEGNPGCPFNDSNEFYSGDEYFENAGQTDDFGHPELSLGSLALLPGSGEVVAAIYDPFEIKSGGIAWWSNTDGAVNREYELYNENDSNNNGAAGKAVGLGDLELMCSAAPLHVGNRVWEDANANGIQDPNEAGLGGVDVTLDCGGSVVTVTTETTDDPATDWNEIGTYAFSGASGGNADGELVPGASCTIAIDMTQGALSGYGLTLANSDGTTANAGDTSNDRFTDMRDSDAVLNGDSAEVSFTAGSAGETNHTFDFGAVETVLIGDRVWGEDDGNGIYGDDMTDTALEGITVTATDSNGNTYTGVTDASGIYTISVPTNATYTVTVPNPAGYEPSTVVFSGTDSDPAANNDESHDHGGAVVSVTDVNNLTIDFAFTSLPDCGDNPTDIGGTVWRDFNMNGVQDAGEPGFGQSGMMVTAYGANNAVAATAVVDADGSYTFPMLADGNAYRLEVSGLPDGLEFSGAGSSSGTGTLFVDGATCAADVSVHYSADYCEDNPELATTCFVQQEYNGDYSSDATFVTYPFSAEGQPGDSNYVGPSMLTTHNQTGATYGVTYQRDTDTTFIASYLRKGSGFGDDGPGAIYAIDSTGTFTLHADINTIFSGNPAGIDPHNFDGDPETDFYDSGVNTSNIAQVSFGDLDISRDGETLYVVNLADRQIYAIPALVTPTAANITTIPTPQPATCDSADTRPFALGIDNNGDLYVGIGCDSSSVAQYIYRYDGGTNFTEVLTFNGQETDTGEGAIQIIADIVFDRNQDMILGVRDVIGDAYWGNFANTIGIGEIYRACWNGTGWDFESNGQCGGVSGHDTSGPDFEFYDDGGLSALPLRTPIGSLALGGQGELAVTFSDPVRLQSAGTVYYDGNGEQTRRYEVYQSVLPAYGKVNGLGDLEALCSAAPLEVGDRIWVDTNENGIQDPDENGIGGVDVTLDCGGTIVTATTATTDDPATAWNEIGTYYFNGAPGGNAEGELVPGASCTIAVDMMQSALTGYSLTIENSDGTTANAGDTSNDRFTDMRDSDAVLNDDSAEISFTAGNAGEANHTFDVGVIEPEGVEIGNFIWADDGDGQQENGEPGIPNVTVTLYDVSGSVVATTTTSATGYYTFTTATHGLQPSTMYTIGIDLADAALGGRSMTVSNTGDDATDSDGESGTGALSNSVVTQITAPATGENYTYDFGFILADWGDLPASSAVTMDEDGPFHVVSPTVGTPTVWLGDSAPDYEGDGQENDDALGDNMNGNVAPDEDGFFRTTGIVPGGTSQTYIQVSGSAATADVAYWIDWDGNGSFADGGDACYFYDDVATGSTISETIAVPVGQSANARVRIRIYDAAAGTSCGDVVPTGGVVDGEVEDWLMAMDATAVSVSAQSAETHTSLYILLLLFALTFFTWRTKRMS